LAAKVVVPVLASLRKVPALLKARRETLSYS